MHEHRDSRPLRAPDLGPAPGGGGDAALPADAMAILPVRDTVLFPGAVLPLVVNRAVSIAAVQHAMRDGQQIGVLMQRDPEVAEPAPADLHRTGTVANILRMVTTPDGAHQLVCQGVQRFRVLDWVGERPFIAAGAYRIEEPDTRTPEVEARFLHLKRQAAEALGLLPQAPEGLVATVGAIDSPAALADLVAAFLDVRPDEKQEILETVDLVARLDRVSRVLAARIEVLRLSAEIGQQTRASLDQRQREAILREQMASIQRQLGEDEGKSAELRELSEAISKAGMPPEVEAAALRELRRLERMPEASPEHGMVRNYLDWMTELPWRLPEEKGIDIVEARRILDEDHFGLERIKRRIVEYLAVRKLAPEGKAPILCFVGPPGVGKTSLGQSIARAMGRPFTRVSLGGVHDEAEIRGHRRTYIGALPGNIIQGIRKAGARNCVMMLDEIDKMGRGIQGDPSAAMLEVLDPEQNGTFRDNYLGVPFDLSRVVFIATANMLDTIPGPLRDRMEIIDLSGYTEGEKLQIARRYLVRRQMEANGLKPEQVEIDDDALQVIIRAYTREAGVRGLEREIGRALRNAAVRIAEGSAERVRIGAEELARDPRRAALRGRGGDAHLRAGGGDRPRLDAGGGRHPVHRGDADAGLRPAHPHRPARRRDAGKRAGGAEPDEEPGGVARRRSGDVREVRHPHPCSCRRDAQGRAERWCGDVHGARLAPDRPHGAERHRDDGRDQPARAGAAGGRHQGKGDGGGAGRAPARDDAGAQPQGLRGDPGGRAGAAGVHLAGAGGGRGGGGARSAPRRGARRLGEGRPRRGVTAGS